MTVKLAFFDEYPGPVLGHHPDLLFGLAGAAAQMLGGAEVRVYCPPGYVQSQPPSGVVTRPAVGRRLPAEPDLTRHNLVRACDDARAAGISFIVNLFLDETYVGLPPGDCGVRFVHVLHRPGELLISAQARASLAAAAHRDVFAVHTDRGRELLQRAIPHASVVYAPWPAATQAEVEARFLGPRLPATGAQHVLMVGGARWDKGISTLFHALVHGPPLRIVGEIAPSDAPHLTDLPEALRVTWHRGWAPRTVIERAIEAAPVVVFPYMPEFAAHGGASGALAQAITFAKPLVVSDVLAHDVPTSAACLEFPAGDATELRAAIDSALAETARLHEAARGARSAVIRAHTFEAHVERLLQAATTPQAGHR